MIRLLHSIHDERETPSQESAPENRGGKREVWAGSAAWM
jgi:hypothetical protein